jgi:iron complex outermembrane receptor protein
MNPHVLTRYQNRTFAGQTRLWMIVSAMLLVSVVLAETTVQESPNSSDVIADPNSSQLETWEDEAYELDSIALYDLEVPTVFSAARREERLDTVPYAMSVITAEDMRAAGVLRVPEALRLVPGVDVAALGMTNYAVSPRGLHGYISNLTLVLIDGRQIYDSLFGGTIWEAWNLPVDNIERIEVIRGPAGATWGTNAVNGVINIITKDPRGEDGLTYIQQGGLRGFHREQISYSWSDEKLAYRVTGEYESHDGVVRGGSLITPLDDFGWSTRGSFRLDYQANETDQWQFTGGHHSGQNGQTATTAFFNQLTPYTRGSYLTLNWTRQVDVDNQISFFGYINDFAVSNGLPSVDYAYQQYALQFSHSCKSVDNQYFTWGIDTRLDQFDGSNADPFITDEAIIQSGIISIYAHNEWQVSDSWRLDLGGRVDYDSYFGFQWSGRTAMRYQIDERSSVYGAISRAYQSAPAAVRNLNLPIANPFVYLTVDQDVVSTDLLAYEIGYHTQPNEKFELGITPYWHEYDNISTNGLAAPPPGPIHLKNRTTAEASLYGVEVDARYRLSDNTLLLGNYTYQDVYWRSKSNFIDSDYIRPPRHKFMTGVRNSPIENLHLSAHLYFTDCTSAADGADLIKPLRIDKVFRLDLRAEYEFWNDRAALAVGVQNLLDNHHYEGSTSFLNSSEVPRMVYAELRLSLP